MGFFISYADSTGARDVVTEVELSPKPTVVEYPQDPTGARIETAGGSLVVQQLVGDNRVRGWVWKSYPDWHVAYQALWAVLQPLRSRYRYLAGDATPYVYLQDTESTLLRHVAISGTTVTVTYPWVRVRVLEVSRALRTEGSSLVVFDNTRLVFVIDDPAFNDVG